MALAKFTLILGILATAPAGGEQSYPRPNLLIDAATLGAKPGDFHILDVRSQAKYDQGHVGGAVRVDPATWAKAFAAGQEPRDWAGKIGQLGIAVDTPVVVYDAGDAKDAARIWWILRYFGARDVRLLNGGWTAWQAAKLPASTAAATPAARAFAIAQPVAGRLATKDQVLKLLDTKPQIVDARSEGEYCGRTKLGKRGGAIPGSVHLEWSDLLDAKTQQFKPAPELARLFKDAGIDVQRPTITYCQSGGRAAVMAFALELMGARAVANYYRSWAEWGNADDTPVQKKK